MSPFSPVIPYCRISETVLGERIIRHICWQRKFKDRLPTFKCMPMFEHCLFIHRHVQTSVADFNRMFPDLKQAVRSQSQMLVLSRDREEDVPKCSGREISRNFLGKIRFQGNGIWECRPLISGSRS